jgi:YgiT-type zinc finger domain-containing protein
MMRTVIGCISSQCIGSTLASGKIPGQGGSNFVTGEEADSMKPKTGRKVQLCAICGGVLKKTTITHEEKRAGKLCLFQHVPAHVCQACGEVWIDELTLQKIDRLLKKEEPVRTVKTPVYDLASVDAG